MNDLKDPNRKQIVSFQIPALLQEKADAAARGRGMSFSLFARESLHLCAHFGPDFWTSLDNLAQLYGTGRSKVLENLVARHVGELRQAAGIGDDEVTDPVINEPVDKPKPQSPKRKKK